MRGIKINENNFFLKRIINRFKYFRINLNININIRIRKIINYF